MGIACYRPRWRNPGSLLTSCKQRRWHILRATLETVTVQPTRLCIVRCHHLWSRTAKNVQGLTSAGCCSRKAAAAAHGPDNRRCDSRAPAGGPATGPPGAGGQRHQLDAGRGLRHPAQGGAPLRRPGERVDEGYQSLHGSGMAFEAVRSRCANSREACRSRHGWISMLSVLMLRIKHARRLVMVQSQPGLRSRDCLLFSGCH